MGRDEQTVALPGDHAVQWVRIDERVVCRARGTESDAWRSVAEWDAAERVDPSPSDFDDEHVFDERPDRETHTLVMEPFIPEVVFGDLVEDPTDLTGAVSLGYLTAVDGDSEGDGEDRGDYRLVFHDGETGHSAPFSEFAHKGTAALSGEAVATAADAELSGPDSRPGNGTTWDAW